MWTQIYVSLAVCKVKNYETEIKLIRNLDKRKDIYPLSLMCGQNTVNLGCIAIEKLNLSRKKWQNLLTKSVDHEQEAKVR